MLGQLLRFAGVGGLATLVHVATAIAAQATLPVTAQQANFTGFCAAVTLSYLGHARFTFGVQVRSGWQVLRFVVLTLLGLLASSGTVWVITDQLGLGFAVAMMGVAVVVPLISFFAMRFWVFTGESDEKTPP
jgi:putative flippase GtrA